MKKHTLKNKFLRGTHSFKKKWSLQLMICLGLFAAPIQSMLAHGTVTSPPSRVWICFQEDPQSPDSPACEAAIIGWGTQAFYDWNEVARMDANGMHRDIIADGNLASAGRPDKYGGLDQVRNDWVSTPVSAGPLTVTWTNTAPHQTLYYDVYITKADWTPDQPLTWDSLERLTRTAPRPASATDNIDVILPARTGKHILYSVWQRSLTAEAFYSTSDIDFGSAPGPNRPPVSSFSSDNGRCGGSEVSFDGTGSFDPNGDAITYSWDFGDGTTGTGAQVSHTYASLDNATVTLTVSDGTFSSGTTAAVDLTVNPDCENPPCPFDTPRTTALPSVNKTYENIYVLGSNGPNLSNISNCIINWDLAGNGLYQFSMSTTNGIPNWYNDISSATTQTFNSTEPQLTISGSNIPGLDGSYLPTFDGTNFVLVSANEGFTIYFSETATAPNCSAVTGPTTGPTNSAPVANLTASVTSGTAPLVVSFDATGSTDSDNDALTYSIDYGDGTSGNGATSSHTYAVGSYTAVVTVSDGAGDTDTASVSITATDDTTVINPTPPTTPTTTGDCAFGAPISNALTSLNTSYDNTYVVGDGGPNMSAVTKFTINWDLANNGLYQFSFNLSVAPYYSNFSTATQNFSTASPKISLSGTGIAGLDGDYYVNTDNGNFVLVAKDYAIYFSNSTTAPNCETLANRAQNVEDRSFTLFPNPATTSIAIQNSADLENNVVTISDLNGKVIKSLVVKERTKNMALDITGMKTGLYLVRILTPSGTSTSLKLVVK